MDSYYVLPLLAAFSFLFVCRVTTSHSCQTELKSTRIVPKYANQCGKRFLKIFYNGNNTEAHCGNYISVLDILETPLLTLDTKGQCKNFTVLMFDPDAVIMKPYLHMLYFNVPACTLRKGFKPSQSSKGDLVASYFFPLAPTKTHRYTIFVYCQNRQLKKRSYKREFFKVQKFAKDNDLGDPIACNFFYLSILDDRI